MLSMQNKRKTRGNKKSNQNKIIEDDSAKKLIVHASKKPQTGFSLNQLKTEYNDKDYANEENRLESGYQNPSKMNFRSTFDCKAKQKNPFIQEDGIIIPNVIHIELGECYTDPFLQRHIRCLYMTEKQRPRKMTRGTQTLYRESSMQTLPYLPDVSNDKETLKTLELYKLPEILKGDGPPGLWEVEVLERARKRWAFEEAMNEKFKCALKAAHTEYARKKLIPQHRAILEAFEWENWLEREERIQGCQMMRFDLVIRIFKKRELEMHNASNIRIKKYCEQIIQKRDQALRQNDIEYGRAMRRLKIKHEQKPRNWRKEKISNQLGDPSSEYYAPQMRYGVNPNRRHFQLSRKAFEMRMEDLEKRAVNMKNLECPFAKIKEWSKPKEQKPEVEQNFCTATNLQKLYEGLKGLREQSRKQKIMPKCLIEKTRKPPEEEVVVDEEYEIEELEICQEDSQSVQTDEESVQVGSCYSQNSLIEMFSQRNSQRYTVAEMLDERRREELENMLAEFEGTEIGWLMRFLSEEMSRLQEQRKLHFVTMLAQKERWRREAAEAGLRQKENEMRKIYEEIFEETDQANTEVCEQYLDNIFGIDTQEQADFEAIANITDLARVIDRDLQRWLTSFEPIQNPLNYDSLRCLLRDLVFPDSIAECLCQKYETQSIVDYIINDVLFTKVNERLDPIDVVSSITNDFVDRLIDNDLYVFTSECSSSCDCNDFCECNPPELEAKAILRKLIRYSVPGRRWRTSNERIADESVFDIVDQVCGTTARSKRCNFSPGQKAKRPTISKAVSTYNIFASSFDNQPRTVISSESSDNSFLDTITVINYSMPKERRESKMKRLSSSERLLYEDTATKSSSGMATVNDLSFPQSMPESFVYPSLLKEAKSVFDVSEPAISQHPTDAEDIQNSSDFSNDNVTAELLNKMSGTSSKFQNLQHITQSFLSNIINRVVKEIIPLESSESDSDFKKRVTALKSKINMATYPSNFTETEPSDFKTEPRSGSDADTESKICESSVFQLSEEKLSVKASEYEIVMYEGELKKILFDDDDECKCQAEIDYKNYIQELYDCGKIKVIHAKNIEVEERQETSDKEINVDEMIFEYTTTAEEDTITRAVPTEFMEEEEEQVYMVEEELQEENENQSIEKQVITSLQQEPENANVIGETITEAAASPTGQTVEQPEVNETISSTLAQPAAETVEEAQQENIE